MFGSEAVSTYIRLTVNGMFLSTWTVFFQISKRLLYGGTKDACTHIHTRTRSHTYTCCFTADVRRKITPRKRTTAATEPANGTGPSVDKRAGSVAVRDWWGATSTRRCRRRHRHRHRRIPPSSRSSDPTAGRVLAHVFRTPSRTAFCFEIDLPIDRPTADR